MLTTYQTKTQRLLFDPSNQFWTETDVNAFINEARGQIAAEGQCVRVLPPSTNGIASITKTAGGSGYTTVPTVVITGPGTGATAHATLLAGAVNTVVVDTAGSGYDKSTTITFTGGGGSNAAATPVINCLNTVNAQEIYTFASANTLAQLTSGINSILSVQTVAVSWGSLRPVLDQWDWNDLQAYIRAYPLLAGQPAMWAQYSQGQNGSIYIQPVPTGALPMDWDCICTPVDLVDDTTPEAIPYPWTDAVPYYAAYVGFMSARRPEEAKNMFGVFEQYMRRARTFVEQSYVPSYYA